MAKVNTKQPTRKKDKKLKVSAEGKTRVKQEKPSSVVEIKKASKEIFLLTGAQTVLLAAEDLAVQGKLIFSEWDLSVATWKRDKNTFGMRGYEDLYPNHKRCMGELINKKRGSLVGDGLIEWVKTNYYQITNLGRTRAQMLTSSNRETSPSPGSIFQAVKPYATNRSFQSWLENPNEPRTWLGVSTFFRLRENTPNELAMKVRQAENCIKEASSWLKESGRDRLTEGPRGGSSINSETILKLQEFVEVLLARFKADVDYIKEKSKEVA
jgi:hypothetical protein